MQTSSGLNDRFWVIVGDAPSGPYVREQIDAMVTSGQIVPESLGCRLGESQWRTIHELLQTETTPSEAPPSAQPPGSLPRKKSPPAPTTTASSSPSKSSMPMHPMAGLAIFGAVVWIGVSLGILPTSCARSVPYFGKHFAHYCDDCNGTGQRRQICLGCNGRGFFGGVRCVNCDGKGRVQQQCQFCAGSGRKPTKK